MIRLLLFLLVTALFTGCSEPLSRSNTTSAQVDFNNGWEFVKDIDPTVTDDLFYTVSDTSVHWQPVTLPHTAQLEPLVISKGQWQGTCFYRKFFELPKKDKGKHVALKFEAAMQVAEVYLNG